MVNLINEIIITKEFIHKSYEILYINLKLNESATIYIMIFYNDETVERTFTLNGDEYLKWDTDDYLYEYINNNIEFIFNN